MFVTLARTVAVTTFVGGSVLLSAGGASAAHCVAPEGDSPGFSYFGNDHNQEATHINEGANNGVHSPGASDCRDVTGSPSDRAPGKA